MHDPKTRRGFLRGLTTLPLIGGGVTLIGNPTKAAEPVTRHLLDCYDTWLFYERRFLRWERHGPGGDLGGWDKCVGHWDGERFRPFDIVRVDNAGGCFHGLDGPQPSSRAAVVLSAVGCDWRD